MHTKSGFNVSTFGSSTSGNSIFLHLGDLITFLNVLSLYSTLFHSGLLNGRSTIFLSRTLPKLSAHTFSQTKLKLLVPYKL